jgi:hypothetical protein
LVSEPGLWLEERLGVLAHFEVVEPVAAPAEPSDVSAVDEPDAVVATLDRLFDQAPRGSVRVSDTFRAEAVDESGLDAGDASSTLCPNQARWAAVAQRMMGSRGASKPAPARPLCSAAFAA